MGTKKKVSTKSMAKMDIDTLAAQPGMFDLQMYNVVKHGLWDAAKYPERLVTGNPVTGIAWIKKLAAQGCLNAEDLQEEQNKMRGIFAAAKRDSGGSGEYDPASAVNLKSGKGMKGSRKPTRDYRNGTAANNGNPTGVVRMGRDGGHGKD